MVSHIANQYYDQESIGKSARNVNNSIPTFIFIEKCKQNMLCFIPLPYTVFTLRINYLSFRHFINHFYVKTAPSNQVLTNLFIKKYSINTRRISLCNDSNHLQLMRSLFMNSIIKLKINNQFTIPNHILLSQGQNNLKMLLIRLFVVRHCSTVL